MFYECNVTDAILIRIHNRLAEISTCLKLMTLGRTIGISPELINSLAPKIDLLRDERGQLCCTLEDESLASRECKGQKEHKDEDKQSDETVH